MGLISRVSSRTYRSEEYPDTLQILLPATMEGKIRRQIEYYFNDFNLMRDQFLKNEIKLSKEAGKDGFIDLDIMLKFNRLAQLTTDKAKIAEACSASKLVEL